MNLFGDSTDISDSQIEDLFKRKKETEMDLILKVVSIIMYQTANSTEMVELYKLLGVEKFSQLLMILDGRTFRLPTANEFKEDLILALVFYYKEVLQYPWNKIKEKFPFEISGISYGIKIKRLNNFCLQKMQEYTEQLNKIQKEKGDTVNE